MTASKSTAEFRRFFCSNFYHLQPKTSHASQKRQTARGNTYLIRASQPSRHEVTTKDIEVLRRALNPSPNQQTRENGFKIFLPTCKTNLPSTCAFVSDTSPAMPQQNPKPPTMHAASSSKHHGFEIDTMQASALTQALQKLRLNLEQQTSILAAIIGNPNSSVLMQKLTKGVQELPTDPQHTTTPAFPPQILTNHIIDLAKQQNRYLEVVFENLASLLYDQVTANDPYNRSLDNDLDFETVTTCLFAVASFLQWVQDLSELQAKQTAGFLVKWLHRPGAIELFAAYKGKLSKLTPADSQKLATYLFKGSKPIEQSNFQEFSNELSIFLNFCETNAVQDYIRIFCEAKVTTAN